MPQDAIIGRYLDWMYAKATQVPGPRRRNPSYRKLFEELYSIPFTYTIAMDGNREADGIALRYLFGAETGISDMQVAMSLDDRPCSVLEMMIALAVRCEEHIMSNPDIGNRTGQWFWDMLVSLGIDDMYDTHFVTKKVHQHIDIFLNRKYERNGRGGLFTVKKKNQYDLRTLDIWYQAMWYLDEIIEQVGE